MASSPTMTAVPLVSSEVNGEENTAVVNTTTGGSESLLTDVVGAKFRPSDSVLAGHYLTKKVSGCTDGPIFPLIKEVDVYQYEPWRLSSRAHDFGDGIMYFFTSVKMKFGKGINVNRLAGAGFWKKTGNSSHIKGEDGTTIATKTPLAYYKNGQKPGELPMKTQWLMKEFILEKQSEEKSKTLALCVVYLHDRKRKPCESNQIPMSNHQNQGNASYSNTQSKTSTNPSITLESLVAENIPFEKCDPNFLNTMMEYQGAADPNVQIASYQSPLPIFRYCFPTQDSGESLGQFNSGSNPSATFESLHADNIPFANYESKGAADPNVHIPGYQSPLPDIRNYFPTQYSGESLEQFNYPSATFESLVADNIPFANYESQVAADPNVHIPGYQSPLPGFRNCLPTPDSGESLEQFNSGSNPSVTSESMLADNIPFANYEQNFSNTLMESEVAVDPNVHIPNYQTPPDFGNSLSNSDSKIEQVIKELLAN